MEVGGDRASQWLSEVLEDDREHRIVRYHPEVPRRRCSDTEKFLRWSFLSKAKEEDQVPTYIL